MNIRIYSAHDPHPVIKNFRLEDKCNVTYKTLAFNYDSIEAQRFRDSINRTIITAIPKKDCFEHWHHHIHIAPHRIAAPQHTTPHCSTTAYHKAVSANRALQAGKQTYRRLQLHSTKHKHCIRLHIPIKLSKPTLNKVMLRCGEIHRCKPYRC